MPHFSVIIPLYNKAPYVRKAVESVVGQTFADWELIVVDNGSTDGSGEIVEDIRDKRIHVIRLEANLGPGAARNHGVSKSSSELICFLDADDWWEPTFLEEMASLIERYPDAGIYGTSYWIVKNGKKRLAPIGVNEGFTEGEINYCNVYAKTLCMPLTSITVCIPRAVFNQTGGFPTEIRLGEDFLLWVHIAMAYKVVFLNCPLANYNQDVNMDSRGTHHLHPPERNMLWRLGDLEPLEKTNADYKQLIDNLRTYSLLNYMLDKHYRNAAQTELAKVDWSRQPASVRRQYRYPIWMLNLKRQLLKVGSRIKQHLMR